MAPVIAWHRSRVRESVRKDLGLYPTDMVELKRGRIEVCPLDLVPFLFTNGFMATGHPFDLPYMVEEWDDTDSHVEELIALTGDYRVARAAYEEAVKRRPGRIVTLRQKTRLLADSRRKN